MNKVILLGRLTEDVNLRKSNDGKDYAFFNLAVKKNKEEADFINCVIWEKQALVLKEYCKKGSQILVEGKIRQRKNNKNENFLEVSVSLLTLI